MLKPFIRFTGNDAGQLVSRRFWDFDHDLQRLLLSLLRELASPEEILALGVEQWRRNLLPLGANRRDQLEQARQDGSWEFPLFDIVRPFFEVVTQQIQPGGRVLYIGAGSGTECFQFARQGLHIIGIDPLERLLAVGQDWADYLGRTADFVCMNVLEMGFKPRSFDGFILEFYGWLPSDSMKTYVLQELAALLKPGGRGFISASRKSYASYWYMMGSAGPEAMVDWLIPHTQQDFFFSQCDASEERLMWGLYNQSHTVDTLAAEFGQVFDVVECSYTETDPRYVRAIVTLKPGHVPPRPTVRPESAHPIQNVSDARLAEIEQVLRSVGQLCRLLEKHHARVVSHFTENPDNAADTCLTSVAPDMETIVAVLDQLLPDTSA